MPIAIRDLVTDVPASLPLGATVAEALETLLAREATELYVTTEDSQLVGVVTDYELLKAQMTHTAGAASVASVMCCTPAVVQVNDPVANVAVKFREARFAQMAVVDEGRLVGLIRRRDVMRLMRALDEEGVGLGDPGDAACAALRAPRFMRSAKAAAEQTAGAGA